MSLLFVSILLVVASLLALFLYFRHLHLVRFPDQIRAPHVVPAEEPSALWGSILSLERFTGEKDFHMQLHRVNLLNPKSKVMRAHLLFIPGVVLFDPKHIKRVITTENYPKSVFYETFRKFFGDGLVFSSGEKWENHRKLLNSGFGPLYLRNLVPAFVDYTQVFINKIKNTYNSVAFNLGAELQKLAMDIIAGTGFGYDLRSVEGKAPPVEKAFAMLLNLVSNPFIYLPYARHIIKIYNRKAIKSIDEVIFKSVEEKQHKKYKNDRKDILDLLLTPSSDENDRLLTKEEIRDELVTFFIAGHETTALTLTWGIYLLKKNPDCMKKLVKEVDDILRDPSRPKSPPRNPTVDDFPQFKYVVMVLRETLRLYPPASVLTRQTPEDVDFDGFVVKKGSTVFLPIYSVHHDPAIWNNPEQFDPERWNDENVAASSSNFYAFSNGPRNCIGQQFFWNEAKVILPMILANFEITLENTEEVIATDKTGTLKPTTPVLVKFVPRTWE